MKKIILILFLTLSTTACLPLSVKNPEYKPMTKGIINHEINNASTNKITDPKSKKFAIILSVNTKSTIDYLNKRKEWYSNQIKSSLIEDNEYWELSISTEDPNFIIKSIISELNSHFDKVTLISDISNIDNYSGFIIIDIYQKRVYDFISSFTLTSNIRTAFFTNKSNLISTAEGLVTEKVVFIESDRTHDTLMERKIITDSIKKWRISLEEIIEKSSTKNNFNYDNCIRQSLSITDKALKSQAMDFCEKQKKAAH